MRNKTFNVICTEPVYGEYILHRLSHLSNRVFIYIAAVHLEILFVSIEHFVRHGITRAAAGSPEQRGQRTIRTESALHDASLGVRCTQNHCAGAVTEQHAGVTVFPVNKGAHFLGTDHQRRMDGPAGNLVFGGLESVK